METKLQRPQGQESDISTLNAAIKAMDLAEKASGIIPAKTVFGFVGSLLTMIRVCFLFFCNDLLQIDIWIGLNGC